MTANTLEHQLIETGYHKLFEQGANSAAASIWNNGQNQGKLEQIIADPSASAAGIFLAAEILKRFHVEFDSRYDDALAKAYVFALEHSNINGTNYMELTGNLWGFLYDVNDIGPLGQQIIKFGDLAVPYLVKLLDNKDGKMLYVGSEDATIGNSFQYRIKDVAAFYISKIKDIGVPFHQDFNQRDKEIERLKEQL